MSFIEAVLARFDVAHSHGHGHGPGGSDDDASDRRHRPSVLHVAGERNGQRRVCTRSLRLAEATGDPAVFAYEVVSAQRELTTVGVPISTLCWSVVTP